MMTLWSIVKCPSCNFQFTTDKDPKGTVNCPKRKGGCGHKFRISTNLIPDLPIEKEQKERKKKQREHKKEQHVGNSIPFISIKRLAISTKSRCKNSKWTTLEDHADIVMEWLKLNGVDLE